MVVKADAVGVADASTTASTGRLLGICSGTLYILVQIGAMSGPPLILVQNQRLERLVDPRAKSTP